MSSKGHKGIGMNGFIARQYDKTARSSMAELYRAWAQKLSAFKNFSNPLFWKMKQNQASRTAEYMALFRALESFRPPGRRLFEDRFAREFLRPSLRTVAHLSRAPLFGVLIPWVIDQRWPGARSSGMARTRFIDEALVKAIEEGIEQVVILGAGFDCRAYRLPSLKRARIFEVDHPDTLTAKREHLRRVLEGLPPHVVFAEIDFNQQQQHDCRRKPIDLHLRASRPPRQLRRIRENSQPHALASEGG